jgi:hypothetical protein
VTETERSSPAVTPAGQVALTIVVKSTDTATGRTSISNVPVDSPTTASPEIYFIGKMDIFCILIMYSFISLVFRAIRDGQPD